MIPYNTCHTVYTSVLWVTYVDIAMSTLAKNPGRPPLAEIGSDRRHSARSGGEASSSARELASSL